MSLRKPASVLRTRSEMVSCDAAEAAGFEVFITTDRNIRYQQNLTGRRIAIVVLGRARWRLIKARLPEIAAAVNATSPGCLIEVELPIE